jgi:hypothetical protein
MYLCLFVLRRLFLCLGTSVIMLCLLTLPLLASSTVSFKLYLEDGGSVPLNGQYDITVAITSFEDEERFFRAKFLLEDYHIVNGFFDFTLDLDTLDDPFLFDYPNLKFYIDLDSLNDPIEIPFQASMFSVVSRLSDRTSQLGTGESVSVNYTTRRINIGGADGASHLNVLGTLNAGSFLGNGTYITGVKGMGLADDHSLEQRFSRVTPNRLATDASQMGVDVVKVTNTPYVGMNLQDPLVSFDVAGRVLFSGSNNPAMGGFQFPLKKQQVMVAWDHRFASFKAGYVSRNGSVDQDSFSHSSVSIGQDIVNVGHFSAVLGGMSHTVSSNFTAVLGGQSHDLMDQGHYSMVVGGDSDTVLASHVLDVGGLNNRLFSKNSFLVASQQNVMRDGEFQTVIGNHNLIQGNNIYVLGGDYNIVGSDDRDVYNVILMGNASKILTNDLWLVHHSVSPDIVQPLYSNQVIWMSDSGVSINTSNITEDLSIGGDIKVTDGNYYYGDGSQLTGILAQDPYWNDQPLLDMGTNPMILSKDMHVGLGAGLDETALLQQLNLKHGLRLSDDGIRLAGTLVVNEGSLNGYVSDSVSVNLLVQDTDSIYDFGPHFDVVKETYFHKPSLKLSVDMFGKLMIFDGNSWVVSKKNYWDLSDKTLWYDRPVGFWNESFIGRLSLVSSDPLYNKVTFSKQYVNAKVVLEEDHVLLDQYKIDYSGTSGFSIHHDDSNAQLLSLYQNGRVSFLSSDTVPKSVYIPTQSQFEDLMIDSDLYSGSSLSHQLFDAPFLQYDNDRLKVRSEKNEPIRFQLQETDHSIITRESEFLIGLNSNTYFDTSIKFSLSRVPMLMLLNGGVVLDAGYSIGVFDTDASRLVGVQFDDSSIQLIPSSSAENAVLISDNGLGIRGNPDQGVVTVLDEQGDAVTHIQSGDFSNSSSLEVKKGDAIWALQAQGKVFSISTGNASVVMFDATDLAAPKLNIGGSLFDASPIDINGPLYMATDVPMRWGNNAKDHRLYVTQNTVELASTDKISVDSAVTITSDGVGFGGAPSSVDSVALKVYGSTHIQNGLYSYVDLKNRIDVLESKTIKGANASPALDNLTSLEFKSGQGFNVSAASSELDQDATQVSVDFDPHFSTIHVQNGTVLLGSFVPTGVDQFTFFSPHFDISILNNAITFKNLLLDSGGDVASSLSVNGVVRVESSGSDSSLSTIYGNIASMTNIPFPWTLNGLDQVLENDTKVGIGTVAPGYRLHVSGTTYVPTLETMVVTTNAIVGSGASGLLTLQSNQEMTLNSRHSSGSLARLGSVSFSKPGASFIGAVNSGSCDNSTNVKFKVCAQDAATVRLYSTGSDSAHNPKLQIGPNILFQLQSNSFDVGRIDRVFNLKSDSMVVLDNIGIFTNMPKNGLDIVGSLIVGDSVSSSKQHALIVQSSVMVGNNTAPFLNGLHLAASKTIRIGEVSADVLKDDDGASLFVNDSLHVHAKHAGTDGLYVSGNVVLKGVHVDDLVVTSNVQQDLVLSGTVSFVATTDIVVNETLEAVHVSDKVGIGTQDPEAMVHIKDNEAVLTIEGNASARVEFEGDAVAMEQTNSGFRVYPKTSTGKQFQMDEDGVDIGYTSTFVPTHNNSTVGLDVEGDIDATEYLLKGQPLSHMPIGSIIMWSGWTDKLPDGWVICDGSNDNNNVSRCDFSDQFVVGVPPTVGLEASVSVGEFTWSQVTGNAVDDNGVVVDHTIATHNQTATLVTHNHTIGLDNDQSQSGVLKTKSVSHSYSDLGSGTGAPNYVLLSVNTEEQQGISYYYKTSDVSCNVWGGNCDQNLRQLWGLSWPSVAVKGYSDTGSSLSHQHDPSNATHPHSFVLPESGHAHTIQDAAHSHTETTSHEHAAAANKPRPQYYTLVFIYLEGV